MRVSSLILAALCSTASVIQAANAFKVTPYVQNPAPDAMSVLWFTSESGDAVIRWWPKGNSAAVQSANITPTEAPDLAYYGDSHAKQYLPEGVFYKGRHRIQGLSADTEYEYEVDLGGGVKYAKSFRTAPSGFRPVRFVAYADSETQPSSTGDCVTWDDPAADHDTDRSATSRKYYVDQTVGYASNICTMVARKPDFFVVAGDLVQTGSCQTHWDEYWRHNAGALNDPAGSTPIFAALGNHEYSSYDAQYGEQGAKKFLTYFETPANGAAVDADQQHRFFRQDFGPVAMIFIDPNNGPDNEPPPGKDWAWNWEYAHPHPLDTNSQLYRNRIVGGVDMSCRVPQFQEGSAQYAWLEEQLADAQTNKLFTFLVCHQCPFSAGYHGRASGELGRGVEVENLSGVPTRCLTNLVFKYGVDAWICGHDEMYEHSQIIGEETLPNGGGKRPYTLNVYDIGIGGDGLRGCRITTDPNPYEVFRAHVDAPEQYDANGTLIAGGKHYGHLEVNVTTNLQGQWTATLTPVYNFVSKNALNGALTFERRTYPDEIVVTNAFFQSAEPEPVAGVSRSWTGAVSTEWENDGNWEPAGVPAANDDVTIGSGTCHVKSALAANSLTVASGATLYFASTGSVSKAFVAYPDEPKTRSFNVAGDLTVAGTLVLGGGWRPVDYKMSEWIDDTKLALSVGGDFTMSGSGTVYVYASPVAKTDAYRVSNGGSLVDFNVVYSNRTVFAVGGDISVGDSAILYPVNDGVTGAPVEFTCRDFTLGASAKIDANDRGWGWFEYLTSRNDYDSRKTQARPSQNVKHVNYNDRSFFTLAPSKSTPPGYNDYACYGGAAASHCVPYGDPYAPFLPGVPGDIYQKITSGGGTVWIVASADMTVNGRINATVTSEKSWATPTGGGVWLCARRFSAGNGALIDVHGGPGENFGNSATSSGGRISLGIGLSAAEIEALAIGDVAGQSGLEKTDRLDAIAYDVKGGKRSETSWGPDGSISTVYGTLGDCSFTVCGNPLNMEGTSPESGTYNYERAASRTFTAPEYGLDPVDPAGVRYRCVGYVLSNATEQISAGAERSVECELSAASMRLTWLWTGIEYGSVLTVPEHAAIRCGGSEYTGSATVWGSSGGEVALEVVPDEGYEFLFWEGEVPFGKARQNPLVLTASEARRLKPVVRPTAAAATVTWLGGTGCWNDPAKWDTGVIPGAADAVVIASGTCNVSNWFVAGSVTLSGSANLRVAYTAPGKLEEAGGDVAGDLTLGNSARVDIAQRNRLRHGNLKVGGDLTLNNSAKLYVAAGPLDGETFTMAGGSGFLTVGGVFTMNGTSTFVPNCEPYTGGGTVVRAGKFVLGPSAVIDASALGYEQIATEVPNTLAPGKGVSYNCGAGYGGRGEKTSGVGDGGATYGFANAPIDPGSPKGYWNNTSNPGGGNVRIHADRVSLAGKIDVKANAPSSLGASSGGGIWITAAKKLEVASTTQLIANGYNGTGLARVGGGGRIAFGLRLTDEELETLALTGELPTGSKAFVNGETEFLAAYPGVTINLKGGASSIEACKGTFRFLGRNSGLIIVVR